MQTDRVKDTTEIIYHAASWVVKIVLVSDALAKTLHVHCVQLNDDFSSVTTVCIK